MVPSINAVSTLLFFIANTNCPGVAKALQEILADTLNKNPLLIIFTMRKQVILLKPMVMVMMMMMMMMMIMMMMLMIMMMECDDDDDDDDGCNNDVDVN